MTTVRNAKNPEPAAPREVRRLTPSELKELRRSSRESSEWAKQQLTIDPELKHLGLPGGWSPGSDAA